MRRVVAFLVCYIYVKYTRESTKQNFIINARPNRLKMGLGESNIRPKKNLFLICINTISIYIEY
jgi:hypothetical protein